MIWQPSAHLCASSVKLRQGGAERLQTDILLSWCALKKQNGEIAPWLRTLGRPSASWTKSLQRLTAV